MNTASKLAIAASIAVVALAALLIAAHAPRTAVAQQPDYEAQCSNGVIVVDPQDNPDSVQEC